MKKKAKTSKSMKLLKEFEKELKRSISTAIIAAVGFILALAWRDVLTEYIETITSVSPIQGKLISALIITILAVIIILLVSHFLKVKEK